MKCRGKTPTGEENNRNIIAAFGRNDEDRKIRLFPDPERALVVGRRIVSPRNSYKNKYEQTKMRLR